MLLNPQGFTEESSTHNIESARGAGSQSSPASPIESGEPSGDDNLDNHIDGAHSSTSAGDDTSVKGAGANDSDMAGDVDEVSEASDDHSPLPGELPRDEWTLEEAMRQYDLLLLQRREEEQEALRQRADIENLRRRLSKEKHQAAKYALEACISDLLPCLDSLERALSSCGEEDCGDTEHGQADAQALSQGVSLVQKQLLSSLEKHGLERVESGGQSFDPEIHQAVRTEPSSEVTCDTVAEVYQNGYKLHDRLLRPAVVRVLSPQSAGDGASGP